MSVDHIQIRGWTSLPVMAYAVYSFPFPGPFPRRISKSLGLIMSTSRVSMWRWVQRLGPVLGSFGADPREVHREFVEETMANVGGTRLIWVAFEPDLRIMPDFYVSPRGNSIDGNSIDAHIFIRRPVHK